MKKARLLALLALMALPLTSCGGSGSNNGSNNPSGGGQPVNPGEGGEGEHGGEGGEGQGGEGGEGGEGGGEEYVGWGKEVDDLFAEVFPGATLPYFDVAELGDVQVSFDKDAWAFEFSGDLALEDSSPLDEVAGVIEEAGYVASEGNSEWDKLFTLEYTDPTDDDSDRILNFEIKGLNPPSSVSRDGGEEVEAGEGEVDPEVHENLFYGKISSPFVYSWGDYNLASIAAYFLTLEDVNESDRAKAVYSEIYAFDYHGFFPDWMDEETWDYLVTFPDEYNMFYLPVLNVAHEDIGLYLKELVELMGWTVDVEEVAESEDGNDYYRVISPNNLLILELYYDLPSKQMEYCLTLVPEYFDILKDEDFLNVLGVKSIYDFQEYNSYFATEFKLESADEVSSSGQAVVQALVDSTKFHGQLVQEENKPAVEFVPQEGENVWDLQLQQLMFSLFGESLPYAALDSETLYAGINDKYVEDYGIYIFYLGDENAEVDPFVNYASALTDNGYTLNSKTQLYDKANDLGADISVDFEHNAEKGYNEIDVYIYAFADLAPHYSASVLVDGENDEKYEVIVDAGYSTEKGEYYLDVLVAHYYSEPEEHEYVNTIASALKLSASNFKWYTADGLYEHFDQNYVVSNPSKIATIFEGMVNAVAAALGEGASSTIDEVSYPAGEEYAGACERYHAVVESESCKVEFYLIVDSIGAFGISTSTGYIFVVYVTPVAAEEPAVEEPPVEPNPEVLGE